MSIMRYRWTRRLPVTRRHEGNRRNSGDRDRAGDLCGVPLLARLAGHADPYAGGAGFAVGTFVLFPLFGFSINTLSMLGLVLAIGLVVDDAIVVVEGVQRHIEEGLAPKDAALKAMEELSGPVVGIALVLASVFVPTAFIPGITGRLYQQFALTIAISVMLSAFNALTLSPALAGLLLRPKPEEGADKRRGPLGKFFDVFNRYWERSYEWFCPLVRSR